MNLDKIVDVVESRVKDLLERPRIPIEASGRHVHLSREAVDGLFGKGSQLTKVSDLSQPGQFACKERIRVIGPKGEFSSVIVLGPERSETQLEISRSDAIVLGINAPVRLSGNLAGSPGIRLVGPAGEVELSQGVVVAERHIHMKTDDAARWGFTDGQTVRVRVFSERPCTFEDVALRVSSSFETSMHIDYDEANACGFTKGMAGIIIE